MGIVGRNKRGVTLDRRLKRCIDDILIDASKSNKPEVQPISAD